MPPNAPYYKTPHWEKLRLQILRRDGWTCQHCGVKALGKKRNGISPHVDHKEQRPNSPTPTAHDVPGNLRTLCESCHSKATRASQVDKPEIGADGLPTDGSWGG